MRIAVLMGDGRGTVCAIGSKRMALGAYSLKDGGAWLMFDWLPTEIPRPG